MRVLGKYREVIELYRERWQIPDMFSSFEYMVKEMERYKEEMGIPSKWSEELIRFVK